MTMNGGFVATLARDCNWLRLVLDEVNASGRNNCIAVIESDNLNGGSGVSSTRIALYSIQIYSSGA
jgi:hypothetical protein